MARFGEKIKEIRLERNMTQDDLARILGTSKQVVSRYENNQRSPKVDVVQNYARALNVPIEYLLDNTEPIRSTNYCSDLPNVANILPLPTMRKIPLIGTIACGTPILATENLGEDVFLPDHIRNADFALRCKGDSMINAGIQDGDIVYIRQQDIVDDGQIAAVVIEDEATLKRVYYNRPDNIITLVAENSGIPPLIYSGETLDHIRIIGKAVGYTHSLEA